MRKISQWSDSKNFELARIFFREIDHELLRGHAGVHLSILDSRDIFTFVSGPENRSPGKRLACPGNNRKIWNAELLAGNPGYFCAKQRIAVDSCDPFKA